LSKAEAMDVDHTSAAQRLMFNNGLKLTIGGMARPEPPLAA